MAKDCTSSELERDVEYRTGNAINDKFNNEFGNICSSQLVNCTLQTVKISPGDQRKGNS